MFNILGGADKAPTRETISQKSKNALGMFHTAIAELEEIKAEAANLAQSNQEVIDSLTAENEELNQLTESNDKIIEKIKNLIS